MNDDNCRHSAELIYNTCRYDCFQLIVKPSAVYQLDLVTHYDKNEALEFVFGKEEKDKVVKKLKMCHNASI